MTTGIIIGTLLLFTVLFIIFRFVIIWYFKIDKMLIEFKKMNSTLDKLLNNTDKNKNEDFNSDFSKDFK